MLILDVFQHDRIDRAIARIDVLLNQENDDNPEVPALHLLPPSEIDAEKIVRQLKKGQTLTSLAKQNNCHRSTLYRILKKSGMSVRDVKSSSMSDEELTDIVQVYNRDHENSGIL